ncbi:MAG TPA: hypothetical protein VF507_01760 [Pyrinomonadaceae bacterium]|jgi:hypothetical protein
MAFPLEPVRSQIYAPIRRFFVNDSDWPFVFVITFLSFIVPYYYRWTLFGLPLSPFSCLAALCAGVAFFSWTVQGKRPRWLKHWLRSKREKPLRGRALAADLGSAYNSSPFLLNPEALEARND